jgi:hypothetical protein
MYVAHSPVVWSWEQSDCFTTFFSLSLLPPNNRHCSVLVVSNLTFFFFFLGRVWRKWSQVLQQSKQRQRRRALRARADFFSNDHKVNLDVLGLQDQQEDFVVPFAGWDYSLWEGWKGKTCGDEQHSTNIFFWVIWTPSIPQTTSQKRFILLSPFDQCAQKEKACMFEWCWLCLLCSLCCLWLIFQKGLQKFW